MKISTHPVREHDDGSERYEGIYQEGYRVGVMGIRSEAPERYYDDHTVRDYWIDGYVDGWRDFQESSGRVSSYRVEQSRDAAGKLYVDPSDNGLIRYRDCEGGTVLVTLNTKTCELMIDGGAYAPIMAHWLSKAISKASTLAYRIEQSRRLNPSDMRHDPTALSRKQRKEHKTERRALREVMGNVYVMEMKYFTREMEGDS